MNIFRFFTILFLKVAKRPARAAATLSESTGFANQNSQATYNIATSKSQTQYGATGPKNSYVCLRNHVNLARVRSLFTTRASTNGTLLIKRSIRTFKGVHAAKNVVKLSLLKKSESLGTLTKMLTSTTSKRMMMGKGPNLRNWTDSLPFHTLR